MKSKEFIPDIAYLFFTGFYKSMKVSEIQSYNNYKGLHETHQKREFIDKFSDSIRNPRDINDCVAVPRGIFKAYLLIMSGSALLALANLIPAKNKAGQVFKTTTITAGWVLNTLSALYFAKGFAFKGLSPTVNRDEYNFKVNGRF